MLEIINVLLHFAEYHLEFLIKVALLLELHLELVVFLGQERLLGQFSPFLLAFLVLEICLVSVVHLYLVVFVSLGLLPRTHVFYLVQVLHGTLLAFLVKGEFVDFAMDSQNLSLLRGQ